MTLQCIEQCQCVCPQSLNSAGLFFEKNPEKEEQVCMLDQTIPGNRLYQVGNEIRIRPSKDVGEILGEYILRPAIDKVSELPGALKTVADLSTDFIFRPLVNRALELPGAARTAAEAGRKYFNEYVYEPGIDLAAKLPGHARDLAEIIDESVIDPAVDSVADFIEDKLEGPRESEVRREEVTIRDYFDDLHLGEYSYNPDIRKLELQLVDLLQNRNIVNPEVREILIALSKAHYDEASNILIDPWFKIYNSISQDARYRKYQYHYHCSSQLKELSKRIKNQSIQECIVYSESRPFPSFIEVNQHLNRTL